MRSGGSPFGRTKIRGTLTRPPSRWPITSMASTIPAAVAQRWATPALSSSRGASPTKPLSIKPEQVQNGFVESLNGRLRDECLNEHLFRSLSAARTIIEAWRVDYNTCRPHTSLGGLTPNAFAARSRQDQNQNGLWL